MKFSGVSTPCVIIPKKGNIPSKPEERLRLMEENMKLARRRGFENPIADLVLQPANLGLVDSLTAYKRYADEDDAPILMGVGNITELMDADSPGINALLCAAAVECGASLLFTTEASGKTAGSVRELSTAVKMMYISAQRKSLPVNLGIDLLVSKEKKIKRDALDKNAIRNIRKIAASRNNACYMDEKGYFKIFVDEKIHCVHYYKNKPRLSIEGKNAREICDTIYNLGLIADLSHALYLGRELVKAEEALIYHRSYQQS
jgi:dihydropteroate synthase-like protein